MIIIILVTSLFAIIIIEGISRRVGDREKALKDALKKSEQQAQEIKRLIGMLSDCSKLQIENRQNAHLLEEKENELKTSRAKITQQEHLIKGLQAPNSRLDNANEEHDSRVRDLNESEEKLRELEAELKRKEADIDNRIGILDDLYDVYNRRVPLDRRAAR